MSDPKPATKKRDWLYIFSPSIIAAGAGVTGFLYILLNSKLDRVGLLFTGLFVVCMLFLDLILKQVLKDKVVFIWVLESVIILFVVVKLTR